MARRSLLFVLLAALALVPAAVADGGGPSPGVTQGWDGVSNAAGTVRYVAVPDGTNTVVEAVQTRSGRVAGWTTIAGSFGTPLVAQDGVAGGLSADGKLLVLADAQPGNPLRTVSRFAAFDPRNLRLLESFELPGDFSFDALSPAGRTLFLIQHVSVRNLTRYAVRAYDLGRQRLLPKPIADRTEKTWVMQGYPLTRVTSAGGRYVYTLYTSPGDYPFVHALDTVARTARCVDLPWRGSDQSALWNVRLSLRDGGRSLALRWRSGRPYLTVDTRSYRVSAPVRSFPWAPVVAGSLGGLALLAGAVLAVSRRRRRGAGAGTPVVAAAVVRIDEAVPSSHH